MFSKIFNLVNKQESKNNISQNQREAELDLLIWAMYIDNKIEMEENEVIENQALKIEWSSELRVEQYINQSISRVRLIIANSSKENDYLDNIYKKLATNIQRKKTYELCYELILSDNVEATEESEFLKKISDKFGL